jgi:hypothetical protein
MHTSKPPVISLHFISCRLPSPSLQSIALLAHLVQKNVWGPFLVVGPTITLTNWAYELNKFCPQLKVLPYWGSLKDRAILRKNKWSSHDLGSEDSPFHVVVTSYQLLVIDQKHFNRIEWVRHSTIDLSYCERERCTDVCPNCCCLGVCHLRRGPGDEVVILAAVEDDATAQVSQPPAADRYQGRTLEKIAP